VHLLISLFATVPGYLSIDEVVYDWMARDFASSGSLDLWNGYAELPSEELTVLFVRIHDGRLIPQYPYLFPVLCYPIYRVAGFFGMFLFNSLAFLGLVALCYALTFRLFDDGDLALTSCLVLVFATFAWEYSQAAWPHVTAALFVLGSFYLGIRAYFAETGQSAARFAVAAGLIAGFGAGIRLDCILVAPCLLAIFLFASPSRFRESAAFVLGTIPGIALLAVTNDLKFGSFIPFSYGTSVGGLTFGPAARLAVAAGLLIVTTWVATRPRSRTVISSHKFVALMVIAIACAAVMAVPETRKFVQSEALGWYTMVVDLRWFDPNADMSALTRSATGGLVYIGAQKKALLQSMPYLVVLLAPVVALVRREKDSQRLAMLFLLPLACAALFGHITFHGGLCLNLRYFYPALPFFAILSAYAIRQLKRDEGWEPHFAPLAAGALLTAGVFLLCNKELSATSNQQEWVLLLPLVLAGSLLLALSGAYMARGEWHRRAIRVVGVLLTGCLVWSFMVAFFYDYDRHRDHRIANYRLGRLIARVVKPNSIFFTSPYVDPFMALLHTRGVRIAIPDKDEFKDFPALLDFHLQRGRLAYAVFPMEKWRELKAGPLAHYQIRPIWSFLENFNAGPNLVLLGPFQIVPVKDGKHGFMLAQILPNRKDTDATPNK